MNHSSNESEWAADRKVGFALGILLVGVVAAMFFRNEPLDVADVPQVERADELDDRLRDRNVNMYADGEAVGSIESEDSEIRWTRPEIIEELAQLPADAPLAIGEPLPAAKPNRNTDLSTTSAAPDHPQILPAATSAATDDGAIVMPGQSLSESLSAAAPVAQDPDVEEPIFEEYTVQYGDTLSGIADQFLGSPNRYRDIYDANQDRMDSPDRLKVGTAIRIPRL